MKQSNSFFSISPALIKNCIKQHWIIPVLMFMTYFITGIFPTMMSYSKFEDVADYTTSCLCNCSAFFSIIDFIIPICTSVAVFHYLHSSDSVTALHSMPFSRKKLYNSALVSGWIMMIIPVIVTGFLFMVLTGAHPSPEASDYSPEILMQFTVGKCFLWIIDTTVIITFVYAISVFAGVIAGTNLIHVLLSVFFNGILFLLFFITQNFLREFIFGYAENPIYSYFSPLTYSYLIEDGLGSGNTVIELTYVAVSIILIAFASVLHQRVRLEREGDATVFGIAGEILTLLVTFVGMTIFSLLIKELGNGANDMVFFFAGAFIGSVLFFAISRMIVEKTAMIISKRNFGRFAVFMIIAAVFFAFTVFDVSGYQKRIPALENVESVRIEAGYNNYVVILNNESDINTVLKYHKTVADFGYGNKDRQNYREGDSNNTEYVFQEISLSYQLKNGKTLRRRFDYSAPADSDVVKAFEEVHSLTAYRNQNALIKINSGQVVDVSITDYYSNNFTAIKSSHKAALLNAMKKDIKEMKYTDFLKATASEISLTYRVNKSETEEYSFTVSSETPNTIDFLKKNGYSKYITDEKATQ